MWVSGHSAMATDGHATAIKPTTKKEPGNFLPGSALLSVD